MRPMAIWLAGIMLGAFCTTGCGVFSHGGIRPTRHESTGPVTHGTVSSSGEPSSPAPSSPASSAFSPVVRQVLAALASRTRVPVQGPANPPGCTGGANTPGSCWPAAWYQVDSTRYWVHVGLCPERKFPLLSLHRVGKASCDQSMAALVSGYDFAGQLYPTAAQARAAVRPSLPPASLVPVALGEGIEGLASSTGLVTWREGDWHFVADFTACPAIARPRRQALAQAESIVRYLHSHLLPETQGTLHTGGSCGDTSSGSTVLVWAWGRDVYTVSTSGYVPQDAVSLTMAMQGGR